jgi:uncharacterized protein with FMN-binding domain
MKRALLVGAGTLAGVAALIALNPEAGTATTATASGSTSAGSRSTSSAGTTTATPTATPSASASSSAPSGSTPSASASAAATTGATATDGTYTGDAVDVGRGYGTVQVEVTVTGGKVVDVTALAVPQNDPRSSQISSQAVPMLVQQAIAAQSASIAGVSGATYTSSGFAQSLRSALVQAGLGS